MIDDMAYGFLSLYIYIGKPIDMPEQWDNLCSLQVVWVQESMQTSQAMVRIWVLNKHGVIFEHQASQAQSYK